MSREIKTLKELWGMHKDMSKEVEDNLMSQYGFVVLTAIIVIPMLIISVALLISHGIKKIWSKYE